MAENLPNLMKNINLHINNYPLQYSCLENLMDRGACQATANGVAKS